MTGKRCERFFNLELFHPLLEVFPGIFFEGYRPSLYCCKNDQGRQRSVFWQRPSKSHYFLSTFDITFLQITWGIILPYRSQRKAVCVHVSALISRPGWEVKNARETSGAFVIVVWVIKSKRKMRWIFHPTEIHVEVAGRGSLLHCSQSRSPRSIHLGCSCHLPSWSMSTDLLQPCAQDAFPLLCLCLSPQLPPSLVQC